MATILWRNATTPESVDTKYSKPVHKTTIIEAGWRLTSEHAPFVVDTVVEENMPISLRDGAVIYADVFRPKDCLVPALVAWSPYGKGACRQGGFNPLDMVPGRIGVPQSRLSGFEKFEAPDPAEWVGRGYAVVNVDARGVYDSDGNIHHFGPGEAKDGHDTIQHVGRQDWCTGSVGLVGNSWLAVAQWFIAAEQPESLKCIAPLEGATDFYREILCRGGIPQTPFWDFLSGCLRGRNKQEDVVGMLENYPLMNEYWESKRADISKITVPAYVLASYSTFLHTFGSFRGFMEIPHDKIWLRVHATQEWHDLYQKSTNDELQLFFDRYLKGIENGWEETPKVRVSILQFNKEPIVNRPFENWPIPNTKHTKLYLTPKQELLSHRSDQSSILRYQSDAPFQQAGNDTEELTFTHTFAQDCTVIGCAKVILYVSLPADSTATDMDIFVQLCKASSTGEILQNINIPEKDSQTCNMPTPIEAINPLMYPGPTGCLRASHRKIDQALSSPWWLEHDYSTREEIVKGQVIKLEIGIWQTGIKFDKGEKLVLKVAGHSMVLAEFASLRGLMGNANKGMHEVRVGGEWESCLVIPVVD